MGTNVAVVLKKFTSDCMCIVWHRVCVSPRLALSVLGFKRSYATCLTIVKLLCAFLVLNLVDVVGVQSTHGGRVLVCSPSLFFGLGANTVVLRLKANRACIVHVGSENGQIKYTVMEAPRRYSFLRFSLPDENSTDVG